MFASYKQAKLFLEEYIPERLATKRVMQLERMRRLCKLLNNPQTNYPIIHVGGTSGKGSTATFASTILNELGLKIGLHISPHLEHINERVQINNKYISNSELVKLTNHLRSVIQVFEKDHDHPPTYFEILVAMSFYYFAQKQVDAAVVEVGLGGTLDATNIIPQAFVILTNVHLDHTHILGHHVAKIARDKMGIIKAESPGVVSGITQPSLQKMLARGCKNLRVPLYLLDKSCQKLKIDLALKGEFQQDNFSLAVCAVKHFVSHYFPEKKQFLQNAITRAANTAFIPGRLEIVNDHPLTIIDGAHNSAKMAALVHALKKLYPGKKWITIVAFKKDKNIRTMLKKLDQITQRYIITTFTTTTDVGAFQAISPDKISALLSKPHTITTPSIKAVKLARRISRQAKHPILITGSLYLVGEVRPILNAKAI